MFFSQILLPVPMVMLANRLLCSVLTFLKLVQLPSRGSGLSSHDPGHPHLHQLTGKAAHAELDAVCTYNSFFSFGSLHISTINSFEGETSIQLYLQVKCLKVFVIFFCGKPT